MNSRPRAVLLVTTITVACVAAAACSGRSDHRLQPVVHQKARVPTTHPKRRPTAVAPLTGRPDPTRASARRPALTVKIENLAISRPQAGVDEADVVYEEVVECGITRLAAVFQSHIPAVIGPIRSVRRTDQAIVRPIRGIFVFSGGAPYAIESIATAPVQVFTEAVAGPAMFRDSTRRAPHNLYARGPDIVARARGASGPPQPLFTYRRAQSPPVGGTRVADAVVGFTSGYATTWHWDAKTGTWLRSIFGRPDIAASGQPIRAANVAIMSVDYTDKLGGACGDVGGQADLSGSGDLVVLTGGHAIAGKWSGSNQGKPVRLLDRSGKKIALAPGTTWVELPYRGTATTLSP